MKINYVENFEMKIFIVENFLIYGKGESVFNLVK